MTHPKLIEEANAAERRVLELLAQELFVGSCYCMFDGLVLYVSPMQRASCAMQQYLTHSRALRRAYGFEDVPNWSEMTPEQRYAIRCERVRAFFQAVRDGQIVF